MLPRKCVKFLFPTPNFKHNENYFSEHYEKKA